MYEKYTWKFVLTGFLAVLAIWGLYAAPLNLGLDLQGGAQIIYRLEVEGRGMVGVDVRSAIASDRDQKGLYITSVTPDSPADKAGLKVGDIIKKVDGIAQDSEETFRQLIERSKNKAIKVDYYSVAGQNLASAELAVEVQITKTDKLADNVIEVLKKRLDGFGLKEMTIRKQGRLGIIIQLPGVNKQELQEVKDVVRRGGKLDFRIVVDSRYGMEDKERNEEVKRIFNLKRAGAYFADDQYDIAYDLEALDKQKLAWEDVKTADQALQYCYLLANPGVSGNELSDARRSIGSNGLPGIGFSFNAVGAKKFYKMTDEHKGKLMAVTLDGAIQQVANIKSAIGRDGIIEGSFNPEEIRKVVVVLKGGALRAKPVLQSEEVVGPSIGRTSLNLGSYAILIATLLVLGFMFVYYKGSGFIANIALVLNLVLILGILTIFEATLTLPGIAGILLTAGMAVDANILIFERIREELEKDAGLKQSVQAGYDRAFWTIFDANLTTLITAFVLFKAGTGPIRGFAVTLMAGILCSLFTALFVTKAIYGVMIAKGFLTEMKMAKILDKTNFNFMGQRTKWIAVSLICLNVGYGVFLFRGRDKYGLDFTGGSLVQIALSESKASSEIGRRVREGGLENVRVVMTGAADENNKGFFFELQTREVAEDLIKAASEESEEGKVTAQDAFRKKVEEIFLKDLIESEATIDGQRWLPIDIDGNTAEKRLRFRVLVKRPGALDTKEEPKLATIDKAIADFNAPSQFTIDQRTQVEQELQELQKMVPPPSDLAERRQSLLDKLTELNKPSGLGVVATCDEDAAASRLEEISKIKGALDAAIKTEKTELEARLAKLRKKPFKLYEFTTGAVPANLQSYETAYNRILKVLEKDENIDVAANFGRVSAIGGSVAYNLKSKALISMFFSLIAIVLYITLRFEFRFGVAAIAALVHDILFTLGFMSLVDLLFSTMGIPFDSKINLPTVAAFLTIIGYSLNDTIVVFDRIRENGHNRKLKDLEYTDLVNTSINQTLSRTILTSVTTFVVVFVLFAASFFGLASIQGLSLALMVGVVVGTYSSIFVACSALVANRQKANRLFLIQAAIIFIMSFGAALLG